MAEKARVQSPGFVAVVQTLVVRFAFLDFRTQLSLVLAVRNANLHQMLNIDAGLGFDEVALVNSALCETFQFFGGLNSRLILGGLYFGNFFGWDIVCSSTFLGNLGDMRFFVLQSGTKI